MIRILFLLGFLLSPTIANATAKFLVLCTTACTWDNTNDAIWSLSSGGVNNTTHPVAADTVTIDANSCVGGLTCTITVNANLSITSLTFGTCTASTTGCILDFSTNNNTISVGSVSGTGTGTRTLNMGNGAWTINGVGTVWDYTTTTNLTHNSNSSSMAFTGTSNQKTMIGGGKSFGNVSATSSNFYFSISGSPTLNSLSVTAPLFLYFATGTTTTITTAFTLNAAGSATNNLFIESLNPGTQATISVPSGTATINWAAINSMVFTGGATFTANNSVGRVTSGITINAPSSSAARCIGC